MLRSDCAEEADFYPCPAQLIESGSLAPSYRMCPSDNPILCPDGSCVSASGDCQDVESCLYDQIQCPDGTCSDSLENCGTRVTCPSSRPFLCPDSTCHANEADCVTFESCPSETPFRCPDTSCATSRANCPMGIHCNETAPILCDDFHCYESVEACEEVETSECPVGRVRCWDNTCRISQDLCPAHSCPLHAPFMCDNGQCVTDRSLCSEACESVMLCRLPPSLGSAAIAYETRCCDTSDYNVCCGYPQFEEDCLEGETRCGDGVCRRAEDCVNGVNCPPEYPYRCAGNTCVSDPLQCQNSPLCRDGWIRCPNGRCAPSYGDCMVSFARSEGLCPSDQPVQCADGQCRRTLEECGVLGPCPSAFPFRCPDNHCVTSEEECGFRNTCPSETQQRCDKGRNVGMCFEDVADCDDQNVCPIEKPVLCALRRAVTRRCPNGDCVTHVGLCVLRKMQCSEGRLCARLLPSAPHPLLEQRVRRLAERLSHAEQLSRLEALPLHLRRVHRGAFPFLSLAHTQSLAQCATASCPSDRPHLCPNGICAADANSCLTSLGCEYRAHIRCDDGRCAGRNVRTGRSLCVTSLTCPAHRPYLCPDASCAAHPFYCPSIQFCPEGFFTCSDASCSPEPCTEAESMCPVSRPVKCDDGQCVSTILDCRNMEGCMAPYECLFSLSPPIQTNASTAPASSPTSPVPTPTARPSLPSSACPPR